MKYFYKKLDHYGIRGHANDFFRTYLTNRQQYMVINDAKSSLGKIECSVPQGSILGPLFFTIYINDIQTAVGPENLRLFGDDTVLFMSHTNLTQLLCDIKTKFKHLIQRYNSNKLTINAEKKIILFHTINKPIPRNLEEISVESMTIKRVNSFNYLGLTLEGTLHWNDHVNEHCNH